MAATAIVPAKTLAFDAEKCRCDVPDTWTEQKVEGDKAAYVNGDQTKSLTMRIAAVGPTLTLDNPSFIKGFESSMVANGVTIIDRLHVTLGGLDAYAVDSTQPAPAGTVYNRMIVTIANGNAYGFNTSKLGGKPSDDDELKAITSSFSFIGIPELPKKEDPMDKVGFYIGVFIGVLAVIATIKWIRRLSGRKI